MRRLSVKVRKKARKSGKNAGVVREVEIGPGELES